MINILLREVSDPKVIYGLLTVKANSVSEVASVFTKVKSSIAETEWQIPDVVALLPKEWEAEFVDVESIYV